MVQNSGYSSTPNPGNPAQSEAWALVEAAKRLAEAVLNEDEQAIRAALRLNWRLWTIFQAELSETEDRVPEQIRENMLSLCQFVDKSTVNLLANPTASGVNTLVNINRNIAQGLMSSAGLLGEAPEGAAAPANDQPPARGQLLSTGA